MSFSKRIDRITPSATLEMTAKAAELRAMGHDVINMSVGEPDFETPENIVLAAVDAMRSGHTRYTPGSGTKHCKEAIQSKVLRDNNIKCDLNQIIVSCGGKHSLYTACQVLFEHGDEVIIFTPYWVSFPDFVSVTGAKPIFVDTDPAKQYEPIFDQLESAITKNTKGIIINSPSNPTGGVWSDEAVLHTIDIAKQYNLWVFSDECYEQLTYNSEYNSIYPLSSEYEKVITFQSCSKTYAMTGWRIGYTIGRTDLIKAMSKLQGQSTSCPNSIAQYAAAEALTGDQKSVDFMRDAFLKRRDLIIDRLLAIPNITCDIPQGAFYVFPDISHYIGSQIDKNIINSANDLSMALLRKKHVVSVAGDSFGANDNIRFSYATSEDDIVSAMEKFESVLKECC